MTDEATSLAALEVTADKDLAQYAVEQAAAAQEPGVTVSAFTAFSSRLVFQMRIPQRPSP